MVTSFINFILKSGNQHAIHSPFLFELYTQVITPRNEKNEDYLAIENRRKLLLSSKKSIQILDLGAGSRINKSNIRSIRSIAKNAEKPAKFGKLFYRLIKRFNAQTIVELGTSLGITTLYLAKAAPSATILSFEGCPETAKIAHENLSNTQIKNVEIVVGNIDNTLSKSLQPLEKIDFAYFDANHKYEPTLRYFKTCLPYAHNDSLFVFDDIYWSDEMKKAWEEIKSHPQVTLTVDLFWIGLVFFRKEQVKEHFKLRF